jgi:hypothetical protein
LIWQQKKVSSNIYPFIVILSSQVFSGIQSYIYFKPIYFFCIGLSHSIGQSQSQGAQPMLLSAAPAVQLRTPAPQPQLQVQVQAQPESEYDSWSAGEDDIIICTQNAFPDQLFKRTETCLNSLLADLGKRHRRSAGEASLRYRWLCTQGVTQQRLRDPLIIAQIKDMKVSTPNVEMSNK